MALLAARGRAGLFSFYSRSYRWALRPLHRRKLHSGQPSSSRMRTRLQSLNSRLPKFLQSYTTPLFNAPVTHITSFLILHELTAIVPLFGLVGVFHYGGWLPSWGNTEEDASLDEGVRKFGKWLRKRGWVQQDTEAMSTAEDVHEKDEKLGKLGPAEAVSQNNQGLRLILEFATAYAITKAMLPVRIMGSVWATPWFARTVLGPVGRTITGVIAAYRR